MQKLGEKLVTLSPEQLEGIHLPPELTEAVHSARETKTHGARRRQIKYIGVILRTMDPEPVTTALENIRLGRDQYTHTFKKIEKWRDDLKAGNMDAVEEIIGCCPKADREHLTHLARDAQLCAGTKKEKSASRMLFRYIKEINE